MGAFVDVFRKLWGWLSSPLPHGPVFLCKVDFTHAAPCHGMDFTHTHTSDLDFICGGD